MLLPDLRHRYFIISVYNILHTLTVYHLSASGYKLFIKSRTTDTLSATILRCPASVRRSRLMRCIVLSSPSGAFTSMYSAIGYLWSGRITLANKSGSPLRPKPLTLYLVTLALILVRYSIISDCIFFSCAIAYLSCWVSQVPLLTAQALICRQFLVLIL